MKRNLVRTCLLLAILFLMASLFTSLLPADHDCEMTDGCGLCHLTQLTENLLHALWLFAMLSALFLYLRPDGDKPFVRHFPSAQLHPSPVSLCVKLSN